MADRWQYAQEKHPAYCTCVTCRTTTRATQSPRPRPPRDPIRQVRPVWTEPRTRRFSWTYAALALTIVIVVYLILTITSPSFVDSAMDSWAQLFDGALPR